MNTEMEHLIEKTIVLLFCIDRRERFDDFGLCLYPRNAINSIVFTEFYIIYSCIDWVKPSRAERRAEKRCVFFFNLETQRQFQTRMLIIA